MKIKLNTILLTLLFAVCFTSLKAQTTTNSITPEQTAAARRMIEASGIHDNLAKVFASIIQQQAAQVPDDKRLKFISVMNQFFDKYLTADAVIDGLVPIYASEYSLDELNQIADFLLTPAGKAMTAKQPEILQQSMAWGQKIASDHKDDLERMMKNAMGDN